MRTNLDRHLTNSLICHCVSESIIPISFYTNTGHLYWVYCKELSLSAEIQTPDGIGQASSTSAC